jgi:hypothetical protein
MFKRLVHYFPDFPFDASCWKTIAPDFVGALQHEARKGIYRLMRRALRSIANQRVPIKFWRYEHEVSRNRRDETIGEMIHASVIERLGQPIRGKLWRQKYKPRNLLSLLDVVKNTYGMSEKGDKAENSIRIVGWDGKPLDPSVDTARLLAWQLLKVATQRLG